MFSPRLEAEPTTTKTSQTSAGEDKIKLAVEHSILEAFGTPSSPQVLNALKAVGFGFNGIMQTVHPYMFCVIDYDNDTILDTINASQFKTIPCLSTGTDSPKPSGPSFAT